MNFDSFFTGICRKSLLYFKGIHPYCYLFACVLGYFLEGTYNMVYPLPLEVVEEESQGIMPSSNYFFSIAFLIVALTYRFMDARSKSKDYRKVKKSLNFIEKCRQSRLINDENAKKLTLKLITDFTKKDYKVE